MRSLAAVFALAMLTSALAFSAAPASAMPNNTMMMGHRKCPRGAHWVPAHRDRRGHWVRAHCAMR
jgi:Spy/CpxP family protein refolding chaperone